MPQTERQAGAAEPGERVAAETCSLTVCDWAAVSTASMQHRQPQWPCDDAPGSLRHCSARPHVCCWTSAGGLHRPPRRLTTGARPKSDDAAPSFCSARTSSTTDRSIYSTVYSEIITTDRITYHMLQGIWVMGGPSPYFPFLPLLFPAPSPFLSWKGGPLEPARGSGERCKLPQRGPGRSLAENEFGAL